MPLTGRVWGLGLDFCLGLISFEGLFDICLVFG